MKWKNERNCDANSCFPFLSHELEVDSSSTLFFINFLDVSLVFLYVICPVEILVMKLWFVKFVLIVSFDVDGTWTHFNVVIKNGSY